MSEYLKNAIQITHQWLDPLRPLSGVDPLVTPTSPFLDPLLSDTDSGITEESRANDPISDPKGGHL